MIRALITLLFFLLSGVPAHAFYDPLSVPNNKYGMHIADFNDISDVATLVNSSGGDWGYVTLVASDNDRDSDKWQRMFDQMRRLHLIPLVRLATHVQDGHWVKPDPAKLEELVSFFSALKWPTENRYIILYNEPNHAKEWGGQIDPEGYVQVAVDLSRKFKASSNDFFILPAGLDVSAASDDLSMDAAQYLHRMVARDRDFLSLIDGWTSHSYPNPGFSGSPTAVGRGTIRSYEWELGVLRDLGLNRLLPVFITETGWIHREGKFLQSGLLSSEQVALNLEIASAYAWNDERVAAVTPFVFNYQDVPFDNFSWKRMSDVGGYYAQYERYKNLPKTKGQPRQREEYKITDVLLPITLVAGSTYTLTAEITNTGQGILSSEGYELVFDGTEQGFSVLPDTLPTLEPGEKGTLTIHLKAPANEGMYRVSLGFRRFGHIIPIQTQDIRVVPPPSLTLSVPLGWRRTSDANDVSVLIYDNAKLIHKFTGLSLLEGSITLEKIDAILPGRQYRIVVLVPYYLPRQAIGSIVSPRTEISVHRMLPLDFNLDGAFTFKDMPAMIKLKPNFIVSLFIGR